MRELAGAEALHWVTGFFVSPKLSGDVFLALPIVETAHSWPICGQLNGTGGVSVSINTSDGRQTCCSSANRRSPSHVAEPTVRKHLTQIESKVPSGFSRCRKPRVRGTISSFVGLTVDPGNFCILAICHMSPKNVCGLADTFDIPFSRVISAVSEFHKSSADCPIQQTGSI